MKTTRVAFLALLIFLLILGSEVVSAVHETICPRVCPRNIEPVCAMKGDKQLEFNNRCLWQAHNCENTEDEYTEVRNGRCK